MKYKNIRKKSLKIKFELIGLINLIILKLFEILILHYIQNKKELFLEEYHYFGQKQKLEIMI